MANWNGPIIKNDENKAEKESDLRLPDIEEGQGKTNVSSKLPGRYGSFSSLKRYTSKTSLISTYDFIRDKVSVSSVEVKKGEYFGHLPEIHDMSNA